MYREDHIFKDPTKADFLREPPVGRYRISKKTGAEREKPVISVPAVTLRISVLAPFFSPGIVSVAVTIMELFRYNVHYRTFLAGPRVPGQYPWPSQGKPELRVVSVRSQLIEQ